MIKKLIWLMCLTGSLATNAQAQQPIAQFQSPEHKVAGNEILIQLSPSTAPQANAQLTLPNGLTLSYGEIVLLAGDYYGNPMLPISLGSTTSIQRQRFLDAFNTLATSPAAVTESRKILAVVTDEENQIQEGLAQGEKIADIYKRIGTDDNIALNCITGGYCPEDFPWLTHDAFSKIYFLKEGRSLQLAMTNFDHFGANAILAYSIGHTLALEKAIEASQTQDLNTLAQAYALNAFANHFLSDIFSSGHMRTPRVELFTQVTPSTVGSVLSGYMHDEDCETGLTVSNALGVTWKAYGDDHYLDAANAYNKLLLHTAMQASADAVYAAYTSGSVPAHDVALDYTPNLNQLLQDRTSQLNPSPLFYWDAQSQTVMRRVSLDNNNDYEWTASWGSADTLKALVKARGLPG